MASDTYKVLVTIADSFEEQGKPLEAIKCLEAICKSEKAEYPQLEAEARLKVVESNEYDRSLQHNIKSYAQHARCWRLG